MFGEPNDRYTLNPIVEALCLFLQVTRSIILKSEAKTSDYK